MKDIIDIIRSLKLIPVIVIQNADDIIPLSEILNEQGLPIAEITFRSECAADAITLLKKKVPGMLIGAGTLLNIESIRHASDAGADFFVSPGFNPKNVDYALKNDLLFIPGVNNPSLVEQAMDMGLRNLKFFPASLSGGTKMLTTLGSVYPDVSFVPTGGVNAQNITEYLSLSNVMACGGSWMVKKDKIKSHQWDTIRSLVKEAVSLINNI